MSHSPSSQALYHHYSTQCPLYWWYLSQQSLHTAVLVTDPLSDCWGQSHLQWEWELNGKDRWQSATVIDKFNPWSYVIKTPQRQVYRRNRQHLRRAGNHNTMGKNEINDSWLDDDIISDDHIETNATEVKGSPQNQATSQMANVRRSQRTIRKPLRYWILKPKLCMFYCILYNKINVAVNCW